MAHKRSKAEIAGIAVFSFCLFVIVAMDVGGLYMAVRDQWDFGQMIKMLIFLSVITGAAYQAVRVRIKPPVRRSSGGHGLKHSFAAFKTTVKYLLTAGGKSRFPEGMTERKARAKKKKQIPTG
jgi:hypothetical protein